MMLLSGIQIPLRLEEAESYGIFFKTTLSKEDAKDPYATFFSETTLNITTKLKDSAYDKFLEYHKKSHREL